MESALIFFTLTLFVAWGALTLLYQFDSLAHKISRIDYFRLIPKWTFFSPNPGHHDMHLIVRDLTDENKIGPWREIPDVLVNDALPPVWNPDKRLAKVLWDAWSSIQFHSRQPTFNPSFFPITGGYVILLNIAQRAPYSKRATMRQFALARSAGFRDRRIDVIFLSQFHARSFGDKPECYDVGGRSS